MSIKIELEFIPVSERLPESGGSYLVRFETTDWEVCQFDPFKKSFQHLFPELPITHWAKLPDLSGKKEEGLVDDLIDSTQYMFESIAKQHQRRRDMFEKVALALTSNSYCDMTSHGDLFDVASKLATDILERADKFARGE